MKWVSVKKKMPREGDCVLCYNGMVGTGFYQEEYCPHEKSVKGWNLDFPDDDKVTYWMPLPQPPAIFVEEE